MRSCARVIALALACLVGAASVALAQTDPDPSESARFRAGAFRFTPSIAVSNLGVDNNVFNEASNPKQDTTAAIGPAVSVWLNADRSRLSGKASGQYLYFKTYENERAWNTNYEGRWDVPMSRITPFVAGSYADAQERAGYEIDARARLKTTAYGLGSSVRLSTKTSFVLSAKRSIFAYDENQTYQGVNLANALNRRNDTAELQLRLRLTPLTTFVVRSEALRDRFDSEPFRDSDSFVVLPGFELRPEALISGTAFVGVRHFQALNGTVPDFTGVVASVSTKYTVSATQIEAKVARDLSYSYEALQPYYALTDIGLTVTERITHVWDVVGRGGWQALGYRNVNAVADVPQRTDHGQVYGAGLGYRLGETLRLGFDANYYRRQSTERSYRNYDGFRFGGSVSYGS